MNTQRDLIQAYRDSRFNLRSLREPSVVETIWDFAGPGLLVLVLYILAVLVFST